MLKGTRSNELATLKSLEPRAKVLLRSKVFSLSLSRAFYEPTTIVTMPSIFYLRCFLRGAVRTPAVRYIILNLLHSTRMILSRISSLNSPSLACRVVLIKNTRFPEISTIRVVAVSALLAAAVFYLQNILILT